MYAASFISTMNVDALSSILSSLQILLNSCSRNHANSENSKERHIVLLHWIVPGPRFEMTRIPPEHLSRREETWLERDAPQIIVDPRVTEFLQCADLSHDAEERNLPQVG